MKQKDRKSDAERILTIRKKLRRWNQLYYSTSDSVVPDEEYDLLMAELRALEERNLNLLTEDSPSRKIGEEGGCENIQHRTPMLSLSSVSRRSEFLSFDSSLRKKLKLAGDVDYCCELKLDGMAISLEYRDGILVEASSRGDGYVGEDITRNVKNVPSIPKRLKNSAHVPRRLEIRGEILIPKSRFILLNRKLKEQDRKIFVNPRSAAIGALRSSDSTTNAGEFLAFYCYAGFSSGGNSLPDSQWRRLKFLNTLGIPVVDCFVPTTGKNSVLDLYDDICKTRPNFDFDTDGLVVKIDSIALQIELGENGHAPRWAVAYKFPPQERITRVIGIRYQVGRTGLITPVAELDPLSISGSSISSSCLHNFGEIERLNLMIGSSVVVRKVGDVIPQISRVIEEDRGDLVPIEPPRYCPSCGSTLSAEGTQLYCTSKLDCEAQICGSVRHFASPKAANIAGMGEKVTDKLIRSGLVVELPDIFNLKMSDLLDRANLGKRSAERLIASIDRSRCIPLQNFVYSLGIEHVGFRTARILAEKFKNLDVILVLDVRSLSSVRGIGKVAAESIHDFFGNERSATMIRKLLTSGVQVLSL